MMHILQGIDIVQISKMERVLLASPGLAAEIFTDAERQYCFSMPKPHLHLAGRFAAKEACLKALGIGLSGEGIDGALREVEVVAEGSGKPDLRVKGRVQAAGRRKKVYQYTVSISHSGDFAVASVILAAGQTGEKS
ncbi:MAG: holo-ACP synthase [Syntrophobacteraceae bacterium]|nr:holo-ACP synthase [Syntrophobacteraceae bacterium]